MLHVHLAVCDDEPFAVQAVSDAAAHCLERLGVHAETEAFSCARDLAMRMESAGFDLVLLDIEMPDADGIKLGQALRVINPQAEIVFVSNSEDRVFESLPVRPLAFVRKSRFNDDMAAAMGAFVRSRRRAGTDRVITLKMHRSMGTFPVDRIAYVEGRGREKLLHMTDGRVEEVVTTLEEMEERLVPLGFCRVHKGFLVNFAQVRRIGTSELYVGETAVPIGRSKTEQVKLAYMNYLNEKNAIML